MNAYDQNHLDDVDDVDDIDRFAARTGGFTNKSGAWKVGIFRGTSGFCMCLSVVSCKVFLPPFAYRTKK